MKDERNYSLLGHNTFGIDVRCKRFLEYTSVDEARQIADMLHSEDSRFLIIGAGSNLLLTGDYEGTVVHSAIRGITLHHSPSTIHHPPSTIHHPPSTIHYPPSTIHHPPLTTLTCGSGETWDDVVAWTVGQGFSDLVNLSLIPGDVGASAVQNIGAYGSEVCQHIKEIRAIEIATGNAVIIPAQDCCYAYRDSRFKQEWKNRYLITHVTYQLRQDYQPNLNYGNIRNELDKLGISSPTPQQLRQLIIGIRQAKLPEPQVLGNAGSFFMNPVVSRGKYEELAALYPEMPHYPMNAGQEKIPAGWLIDQCGWKGRSLGRAGVYEKQALVLVNLGGATGQEIVTLCHAIQEDVNRKFGISLKPEVNIV